MAIKIGINGYGRIGRNVLRALYESNRTSEISIVAVNDLGDANTNAHLTRRDTAHGRFPATVTVEGDYMVVNGDRIRVLAERDPAKLPWGDLGVDIVIEATGLFASRDKAAAHLKGGAKKVIISAPAGKEVDATIVYGVNHNVLRKEHTIVSNASCTTNCLAPLVKPLHEALGIKHGLMTTVHAYTNDQVLTDVYHKDLRRARAAAMSQIPTKTGAASAIGLVLPELDGRLDGFAIRVPTLNVSVVDLTFVAERSASVDDINSIMKEASEGSLKGVLDYNDEPLVSIDFNHHPASSIFDAGLTKVIGGTLVKVLAWYDNEWGFSNRLLDTTVALANAS
ncbi:MAG TPA: type I glyceraldehyde-3-phosphate dehydrogenase [Woeseiaceae bacterium]|nr:type I glyceraldehyde-3-phosphate dehydrogenase [Woeseiaceae bacterium]